MGLATAAAIGLGAGVLAARWTPGRDPAGLAVLIALGSAGAVLATLLGAAVGWCALAGGRAAVGATAGAAAMLIPYRALLGEAWTGTARGAPARQRSRCTIIPSSRPPRNTPPRVVSGRSSTV